MARRRADGGSFAFDLIPDDDETFEEVPVEPSRAARVAGALGARVRSWPRRRVVAIATVLTVGIGGTVGVTAFTSMARQRAWAEVAASAPGAVLSLEHEPVEAWRVEIAAPVPVGLLGDVLVVQSSQWDSNDGPTLYGIDLEAGAMAWTTVAPHASECSVGTPNPILPLPSSRVARGDVVVCLSADRRLVSVVDSGGTVLATRELADLPLPDETSDAQLARVGIQALVTSDGGLLRFDRVDELAMPPAAVAVPPPDAPDGVVYSPREATLQAPLAGASLRVRLEDAATGDIRWETVLDGEGLPAGATLSDASGCLQWGGATGDVAEVTSGYTTAIFDERTVWAQTCGIDAVLDAATGEVLERRPVFQEGYVGGNPPSLPLVDGGYAEIVSDSSGTPDAGGFTMHVRRDDGSVVGDVPGLVVPPWATDGPRSALLVTLDWATARGSPRTTPATRPRGGATRTPATPGRSRAPPTSSSPRTGSGSSGSTGSREPPSGRTNCTRGCRPAPGGTRCSTRSPTAVASPSSCRRCQASTWTRRRATS